MTKKKVKTKRPMTEKMKAAIATARQTEIEQAMQEIRIICQRARIKLVPQMSVGLESIE